YGRAQVVRVEHATDEVELDRGRRHGRGDRPGTRKGKPGVLLHLLERDAGVERGDADLVVGTFEVEHGKISDDDAQVETGGLTAAGPTHRVVAHATDHIDLRRDEHTR